MSFLSFLSKIFGNKSEKDLKEIQPILDKILEAEKALPNISNDELRDKISQIREDISASILQDQEEVARIKEEVELTEPSKRQPLWDKIDNLEKDIIDTIDAKLDYYLPLVFAVIRETARRFAANETIEVTATAYDRLLAAQGKDFVSIDGDKALWKNHWVAGGNEIKWDMVHYNVQLIGGIVLHQGKIAEMATGEGKTLVATLPVFLRSLSG